MDEERLLSVLRSGNWGGYPFPNRYARQFAERFVEYQGGAHGICVANGTVAIAIALRAAGIAAGDEVIVPAYTWDGTATAVLDVGAVPVFADIDPQTYCLDAAAAAARVTPRTRALLPVHLAQRFADLTALRALAAEHQLKVIEDCAHAHGGQFHGEGAGAMGELGTFSFQSSKLMTSGEGGFVMARTAELFERVQTIVNCGRASETDHYGHRPTGGNYRLSELQAALLLGQLEMLPALSERRARNAAMLSELLAGTAEVSAPPPQPGITREAIYQYVVRYHAHADVNRDLFCAALDAEGIPTDGRFYEPVYRSDLFKPSVREFPQLVGVDFASMTCPVAERAAYEESLWMPHFVLLGDEPDVADIARAVRKVVEHLPSLRKADPKLAGLKAVSRADRPRFEKKNY
jgi:dTDP-4-amino-4,6-dideoxygalactose transaminase